MPPRKRPATKTPAVPRPSPHLPWKRIGVLILGILLLGAFLVSTGLLQDMMAGPKTPLPRVNLGLGFGTDIKDVKQKFPDCEDRSFNDNPLFRIITLKDREDLPEGAREAELIFFRGKLFFVSAKWEGDLAARMPMESWTRQYKRWRLKTSAPPIPLQGVDKDTSLQEWYFRDGETEMILRDLRFKDQVNRWKDLRDSSNREAQEAFAQYRFDIQ